MPLPDPVTFPITIPFMAAKDVGKGSSGPGIGRGRGNPDPDEHPEFQNGACLNHPEGCGLDGEGSAQGDGSGRYYVTDPSRMPEEPPMGRGGTSYYYTPGMLGFGSNEDPRDGYSGAATGTGR